MCVSSYYSTLEASPGERVDGRRTLGENIADLGGVRLAYESALRVAGEFPWNCPAASRMKAEPSCSVW